MLVFKSFFKVVKYYMYSLIIYLVIYAGIMCIGTGGSDGQIVDFEMEKTNAIIINEDGDSELIQGFEKYIGQYVEKVEVEDDKEKLQDALFFREAEYILRIPKGFTEAFLQGEIRELQKTLIEDSPYAHLLDNQIETYFKTLDNYRILMPDKDLKEWMMYTDDVLKEKAEVSLTKKVSSKTKHVETSMNYMSYIMMSMIVLTISMGIEAFYKESINKRNACSAKSKTLIYIELLGANIVLAVGSLVLLLTIVSIQNNYSFFSREGMLFVLNGVTWLLVVASIGFVVGILVQSKRVQEMITNVMSLGLSFISGVFVAQEYLPIEVINVSKFLPTYWYIEANSLIADVSNFEIESLMPIINAMGIQLGFAVAIICVGIVINKQKRAA